MVPLGYVYITSQHARRHDLAPVRQHGEWGRHLQSWRGEGEVWCRVPLQGGVLVGCGPIVLHPRSDQLLQQAGLRRRLLLGKQLLLLAGCERPRLRAGPGALLPQCLQTVRGMLQGGLVGLPAAAAVAPRLGRLQPLQQGRARHVLRRLLVPPLVLLLPLLLLLLLLLLLQQQWCG
jgi:hypothetical protein